MLDQATLQFVADHLLARVETERVARDAATRAGRNDVAVMHGDRAQVLIETARTILHFDLRDDENPPGASD